MRILVTGAAGFIGSHLCDNLLSKEFEVLGIDNLSLGKEKFLSEAKKRKKFTFIKEDLTNYEELEIIFKEFKPHTVFHLAANSDISKGTNEPSTDLNSNFISTFNVLEMMVKVGCNNIVFSSTSAIYGEVSQKISEDYGPLMPTSLYGASKLSAESYIYAYSELFGINYLIFRFPNVIGNRATHGVIFDFINKLNSNNTILEILGDGLQEKPYMHVSDLISAIITIWELPNIDYNVFNLGVETSTSVNRIASEVIRLMNLKNVEISYTGGSRGWKGDVPRFKYDLIRLKSTGWMPNMSSDEAVTRTIKELL
tara:strand:- start:34711 stop:35643 length:933 start_codon:yes stop_codon:yes gene_type:complete